MVEHDLNPKDEYNDLILSYFKENLPTFSTKNVTNYGPYWGASFVNQNGIEVRIRGENDVFDIIVNIAEEEIPLWKYNRSVMNSSEASKDNILYQLTILKSLLI